jgi:glycosyltransferase involved in cell wall biosynthesis
MSWKACHSRKELEFSSAVAFCCHPRVHIRHGLVTPAVCNACPFPPQPPPRNPRQYTPIVSEWYLSPSLGQIAVIIPSHNYGRYLSAALDSVLEQTVRPEEVVVVDDSSTDNTREVVRSYEEHGVRYLRVDFRNAHLTRCAGFQATRGEVVCFLDADDRLSPEYFERGLEEFRHQAIGIVYSDMQCFGDSDHRMSFPETFDADLLERRNYIHAGSLVLREALVVSRAFDARLHATVARLTGDWWLWKSVVSHGWQARRQRGVYYYRRHSAASSSQFGRQADYYDTAHLGHEMITWFIPLSGRSTLWPRLERYLDEQSWPHDRIRLILLDTSQDEAFSWQVRNWTRRSDYSDVRHVKLAVGDVGLADLPRVEYADSVRRSMSRIYGFLRAEATTRYVWVLEDDVFPPRNACEQLLRGFDESVGSVAGAYRSRFHTGYVAWDSLDQNIMNRGEGIQLVAGNGFGCVVLRGQVLRDTVFTVGGYVPDFDHAFYARLLPTGLRAKLDWRVECEHVGTI